MERLDKLLAATGRWSRKEVKDLIKAGRVTVNGTVPTRPEEKAEATATITVDGNAVTTEKYTYLMLHKPAGLISATEDPKQKTVLELLPPHLREIGLFPAGRLDRDTEGLLLLTNDGGLAHDLLSPKKHVDKTYFVRTEGALDGADVAAFAQGLLLGDGLHCMPAGLELLPCEEENQAVVTLHEGKYHQIKRMLAARGKPVCYLKRLTMGPLTLDPRLEKGAWRPLTPEERQSLLER